LELEDVGEILNEYIESVFTEHKDMEDRKNSVEHAKMLGHFVIQKEMVLGLWRSIKMDKTPGPNGIYPRLLREAWIYNYS